jgi:MFS family permease
VPLPTLAPPGPARAARTLLLASTAGTVVEWYDFFVFATAAALVFDRLFFPRADPLAGVLLALMTYAVGFVTRPLGGLVFGILGDRYGRKRALVWSLFLMGGATVGVGLLPTYATAGALAPALLVALRLVQGLAVGGEVGGAVLLVAESLPAAGRGRWTAWPQTGGPAGNVLAAGVVALVGAVVGEEAFAAWGWRVPFLLSAGLVGVGAWTRRRVEESPLYAELAARRAAGRAEPRPALAAHRGRSSGCCSSRRARTRCSTCSCCSRWCTPRACSTSRGLRPSRPRCSPRRWRCRWIVWGRGAVGPRGAGRPVTGAGSWPRRSGAFALFQLAARWRVAGGSRRPRRSGAGLSQA